MTEKELIDLLQLEPLQPEGGFFRQTFKSKTHVGSGNSTRALSTCIYYLLTKSSFSAFHKVKGTEIFHFYLGDPAEFFQISEDGSLDRQEMGPAIQLGHRLQVIVPPLKWQALRLLPGGRHGWALFGTTVSPGFEFEDFELASRNQLISHYPSHKKLIEELTRA